jgi:triosephosphate isomerase
MRKTIIAGNWKMFKKLSEANELVTGLKQELANINPAEIDILICPPYTVLSEVRKVIENSNVYLGAQDVYWEDQGAFTGEVSPVMLKDIGCSYVIIGHSERRQYFHETNQSVNKKAKAVLKHGLTPIICVGETLKEREENKIFTVIDDHIKNGLKDISPSEISKTVIAYEPVWAIGTGKTATPAIAQEVQGYIRDLLVELYGKDIAGIIRIQYGGSVKTDNISDLMKQPDIDGALVGGASLKVDSFSQIVKKALEVKK